MTNFLQFAKEKLEERDLIFSQEVGSWSEEKFSEEELAKKQKCPPNFRPLISNFS